MLELIGMFAVASICLAVFMGLAAFIGITCDRNREVWQLVPRFNAIVDRVAVLEKAIQDLQEASKNG